MNKILILATFVLALDVSSGGHLHAGHNHRGQGERESDGSPTGRAGHHEGANAFDHEAILGSVKEAEEFDKLSPTEAKRRLKILVGKMDTDKDGRINKVEMKQWILRSFKMLSNEESSERFRDSDIDNDGFVTWEEYLREEFDLDEDESADEETLRLDPERAEELSMIDEDRTLFSAADKNRDGRLDASEFVSFTHPEDDVEMHETVVSHVLETKDINKDGVVDYAEYIGDRGKDQTKDWLLEEKTRFDEELDQNRDGSLSQVEIKNWMIVSNEEIAEDEVNHLFAGSDDDVDGFLSLDEILDHHDIFVGSEATDYGEHLSQIHKFEDEL